MLISLTRAHGDRRRPRVRNTSVQPLQIPPKYRAGQTAPMSDIGDVDDDADDADANVDADVDAGDDDDDDDDDYADDEEEEEDRRRRRRRRRAGTQRKTKIRQRNVERGARP